jgi:hypothetical protein
MEDDEKLTLVDEAITRLESITDSKATPVAVMAWISLHAHIDLPVSEIGRYMHMVYQKRNMAENSQDPSRRMDIDDHIAEH